MSALDPVFASTVAGRPYVDPYARWVPVDVVLAGEGVRVYVEYGG